MYSRKKLKFAKNKKLFFNFTLFFSLVILFLIVPSISHAGWLTWVGCLAGAAGGIALTVLTLGAGAVTLTGVVAACGAGAVLFGGLSEAATDFLKALLRFTASIINIIASQTADWAVQFFNKYITIDMITRPISSAAGVSTGWLLTRDLANMLVVIGFVIIAIATILRIREYEAQRLLLPLIIVALLINFSKLFCGIIIDFSNILTIHFLKGSGAMGNELLKAVKNAIEYALNQLPSDADLDAIAVHWMGAISYVMITICFFYLGFLLYARTAMFGILMILSPLAFVAWVFPQTKNLFQMWLQNFIKWVFIGAQICFFVWVASLMLSEMQKSGEKITPLSVGTITILLYVAATVARRSSGPISAGISKLGGGALGFVAGAAASGALKALEAGKGIADKVTKGRISEAAQRRKDLVTRGKEWLGVVPIGTAATRASQQVESLYKPMSAEYEAARRTGNIASVNRIRQLAVNGRGPQAAAAMKVLTEKGDLGEAFNFDYNQIRTKLQYAERMGASGITSSAIERDPNCAGSPLEIAQAARRASLETALKWSPSVFTPEVVANLSPGVIRGIGERGSDEVIERLKQYKRRIPNPRRYNDMVNFISNNFPAGSQEEVQAKERLAAVVKELETNPNFR